MRTLLKELQDIDECHNANKVNWLWRNQQKIAKAFDEHQHGFSTQYGRRKTDSTVFHESQEPTLLQAAKEYVDNTSEFKFGHEVELSLLSKLRAAVEREEGKG